MEYDSMATNHREACESLSAANDAAGDTLRENYSATSALIGIGYALLALADTINVAIEKAE
jgi:hypothetical protein